MRNVIFTDILRAQKKKSLIICGIILAVITIGIALFIKLVPTFGENAGGYYESLCAGAVNFFMPLLIGIPIFSTIYTDDFRSRSMQIAIGRGVSRTKMMLARFLETLILLIELHLVFSVIMVICGVIDGADGAQIWGCIGNLWSGSIRMTVFMSLALLFVYWTQNPTTGLVFYIIFAASVLDTIFALVDMIPVLSENNIEISKFFPGSACSQFVQAIADGDVLHSFTWGIGVIIGYIVLPIVISIQIFKRKELEF